MAFKSGSTKADGITGGDIVQSLIKIVLDILQDKSRLKKLLIFAAGLALVSILFFAIRIFNEHRTDTEKIIEFARPIQTEADRLNRITDGIDQKTEAEVKLNEKISVSPDAVLSVIDALISQRAERIRQEGR